MKRNSLGRLLLGVAAATRLLLAVSYADTVYVANSGNNTIEQFSLTGAGSVFISSGLNNPKGVAFDSAGNLYVTNHVNNTISKITPGGVTSIFASSGLSGPDGLAFDAAGNLYVASNFSNTIVKFTPDGASSVFANAGLSAPQDLAFDAAGNLYVTNLLSGLIVKFTPNGVGSVFGNNGSGCPWGLAFDGAGNLYVANTCINTIVKFTPDGVSSNFASAGLQDPVGLAFDSAGYLYAVNLGQNGNPSTIEKFAPNGAGSLFANSGLSGSFGIAIKPGTLPVPPPTPTPRPASQAQLLNISTRMHVQTGNDVLIGGFIVTGAAPKKVLLRAIGPSLAQQGVTGVLSDPELELHAADGSLITSNDNWKDTQQAEIEATGIPPSSDLESALIMTLEPNSYTAIVSGKNATSGVGLIEVYDLDQSADSQLANISTRGFVESEGNVMIGGFILGNGVGTTNVLLRALGPSLATQGVSGVLADPTLELHDANGVLIMSNDNWKDTQQAEIEATGIPPANDLESAIIATLPATAHTAVVAGKNGGTGVGLVEAYRLP